MFNVNQNLFMLCLLLRKIYFIKKLSIIFLKFIILDERIYETLIFKRGYRNILRKAVHDKKLFDNLINYDVTTTKIQYSYNNRLDLWGYHG